MNETPLEFLARYMGTASVDWEPDYPATPGHGWHHRGRTQPGCAHCRFRQLRADLDEAASSAFSGAKGRRYRPEHTGSNAVSAVLALLVGSHPTLIGRLTK